MSFCSRFLAPAALLLAAFTATAQAVVLDWDTATWTNGSTTGSANGVDISITPTSTGLFQPSTVAPNPMTPAVTRAFDGGLAIGERSLEIAMDLPNKGESEFITITLTFNSAIYASGVMDVSFKLFDIDYANVSGTSTYQDRVFNLSATTVGGATLTPTVSGLGSAVTFSGGILTGTASVVDTGAGSGDGNAQIDYNASFIRSITFSYGTTSAFNNPTYQHIGIHDVNFTPVPEINPAFAGAISCFAATGLIFYHRARVRSRRQ